MAEGIKISEMPIISDLNKDCYIPVVKNNNNSKYKALNVNKYSTQEITIGEWIDGKPICRKVFPVTLVFSGNLDDRKSVQVSSTLQYPNYKVLKHYLVGRQCSGSLHVNYWWRVITEVDFGNDNGGVGFSYRVGDLHNVPRATIIDTDETYVVVEYVKYI